VSIRTGTGPFLSGSCERVIPSHHNSLHITYLQHHFRERNTHDTPRSTTDLNRRKRDNTNSTNGQGCAIFSSLYLPLARSPFLPNQSHAHACSPLIKSISPPFPQLNPTSSTQLPPARGTRKGREGHRRRIVLLWPRGRRRYPHVVLERYHHRPRTRTSSPLSLSLSLSFPSLPTHNLKNIPKSKTTKKIHVPPLLPLPIPSTTTHAWARTFMTLEIRK
jgi:hypothetical protein